MDKERTLLPLLSDRATGYNVMLHLLAEQASRNLDWIGSAFAGLASKDQTV